MSELFPDLGAAQAQGKKEEEEAPSRNTTAEVLAKDELVQEDNTQADWAAYIAMALSLAAFIPASLRIWQRKSATDVSLLGLAMRLTAASFWLTYAVINRFTPNMVSSSLSLTFILFYLGLVLRYGPYWPGASEVVLVPTSATPINKVEVVRLSDGQYVPRRGDIPHFSETLPPAQGYVGTRG